MNEPTLRRTLGLFDAVAIGVGSMIGAGVFVALAPAAAAAGSGIVVALAIAAAIAYCNATSSARLAALYPVAGGTYVYGTQRLGPVWGYLAGWGFVIGKTASCAAIALTVGLYVWPAHAHLLAVAAVITLTAVNCVGVQKAAWFTRATVAVVIMVLVSVVFTAVFSSHVAAGSLSPDPDRGVAGMMQSAGILFFAFAGYARIATLGEEVRDPSHTIPRAIVISLGVALVVYASVAVSALWLLGAPTLARSPAPLAAMTNAAGASWLTPIVGIGAVCASLGSLMALLLGVSRTTLAMARDGHFPRWLAAIQPRYSAPQHAEIVVGAVVAIIAAAVDIRAAIGFSSFGVLVYYAIANASALTLNRTERRPLLAIPLTGAFGCVALALSLPTESVLAGTAVFVIGGILYGLRLRKRRSRLTDDGLPPP